MGRPSRFEWPQTRQTASSDNSPQQMIGQRRQRVAWRYRDRPRPATVAVPPRELPMDRQEGAMMLDAFPKCSRTRRMGCRTHGSPQKQGAEPQATMPDPTRTTGSGRRAMRWWVAAPQSRGLWVEALRASPSDAEPGNVNRTRRLDPAVRLVPKRRRRDAWMQGPTPVAHRRRPAAQSGSLRCRDRDRSANTAQAADDPWFAGITPRNGGALGTMAAPNGAMTMEAAARALSRQD